MVSPTGNPRQPQSPRLTRSYITISYHSVKRILLALGCIAVGGGIFGATQELAADLGAGGPRSLAQRSESFTVTLKGAVPQVTPLFGPVREAEWAHAWKPDFIHPAEGAQQEGTVFKVHGADGRERIWLLSGYDVEQGRVEYVFVAPNFTITELKINIAPAGDGRSKATVTYRYSALSPEGNQEVAKIDSRWAEEHRHHWQAALDEAISKYPAHD